MPSRNIDHGKADGGRNGGTAARPAAVAVQLLRGFCQGIISDRELRRQWPEYNYDEDPSLGELLDDVVNVFYEPESDQRNDWADTDEKVAQVAIEAIEGGWSAEQFWHTVETGERP